MNRMQLSRGDRQFGNERGQADSRIRDRSTRRRTSETQRELMALISYLRQQESGVLDAMQRLRDAA